MLTMHLSIILLTLNFEQNTSVYIYVVTNYLATPYR